MVKCALYCQACENHVSDHFGKHQGFDDITVRTSTSEH